jgi:hypothetical protein
MYAPCDGALLDLLDSGSDVISTSSYQRALILPQECPDR